MFQRYYKYRNEKEIMKKLLFLLLLSLGCDNKNIYYVNRVSEDFVYFKDKNTELCFAIYISGASRAITHVPCSEKVEKVRVK